jgi:hypothetical protein
LLTASIWIRWNKLCKQVAHALSKLLPAIDQTNLNIFVK